MMWARIVNNEIAETTEFNPEGKFISSWVWVEVPSDLEGIVRDVPDAYEYVDGNIQVKDGRDPYAELDNRPSWTADQVTIIESFNNGDITEEELRSQLNITAD